MKKVLVTGGAGFIGSNLVKKLLEKGCKVTIIDNMSVSQCNVPEQIKNGVKVVEADIKDFEDINEHFRDIDTVFHLAAMNRAARSVERPLAANHANITGTINVLEAAKQAGCKKVINISSSSVYGGVIGQDLLEDMPLRPPHPYGVGKLAGEHYSRVYNELYGLPVITLRFFSVYGPRQLGFIEKAGVVATFIKQIEEGKPLTLFGDGKQRRNFTFVEDTVNFLISAAEKDIDKHDIFNVANENEVTILDLIEAVEKATGKKAIIEKYPLPPGDPAANKANIDKAKKHLNYNPKTNIDEGIKQTVIWFREHGRYINE